MGSCFPTSPTAGDVGHPALVDKLNGILNGLSYAWDVRKQ
jgi:hypothetical protein